MSVRTLLHFVVIPCTRVLEVVGSILYSSSCRVPVSHSNSRFDDRQMLLLCFGIFQFRRLSACVYLAAYESIAVSVVLQKKVQALHAACGTSSCPP